MKTTLRCQANRKQVEPEADQPDICMLEPGHEGSHEWWDRWALDHPYDPLLKVGDGFVLGWDWGWLKDGIPYEVEEIFPGPPDGSPMYRFAKDGASFGTVYADLVDDEIRDGFAEALRASSDAP